MQSLSYVGPSTWRKLPNNLKILRNTSLRIYMKLKWISIVTLKEKTLEHNQDNHTFFFFLHLKLVSAIFYQIFTFSQDDSPLKTMKNVFLFHLKSSFHS